MTDYAVQYKELLKILIGDTFNRYRGYVLGDTTFEILSGINRQINLLPLFQWKRLKGSLVPGGMIQSTFQCFESVIKYETYLPPDIPSVLSQGNIATSFFEGSEAAIYSRRIHVVFENPWDVINFVNDLKKLSVKQFICVDDFDQMHVLFNNAFNQGYNYVLINKKPCSQNPTAMLNSLGLSVFSCAYNLHTDELLLQDSALEHILSQRFFALHPQYNVTDAKLLQDKGFVLLQEGEALSNFSKANMDIGVNKFSYLDV